MGMRPIALYLLPVLAIACGTTFHGSADVEVVADGGETSHPATQGGTKTLSAGGSGTHVDTSGAAGMPSQTPGGGETSQGGETPMNSAGQGGAVSDGGADTGGTGDNEAGSTTGGSGIMTAPFWKTCGDAVCADNELCVSRAEGHVCIVAGPSECAPNESVNDAAFMSQCKKQPIQCSVPYRRCLDVVNTGAVGTCPTMGKDPFTLQIWSCGPPL